MKNADITTILNDIIKIPDNFHGCGTVSPNVLKGIVKYTMDKRIENSIETGSGKTTLLFSHLSNNHKVFSVNDGDSISVVKNSYLLNLKSVEWIEGPTQITLPRQNFNNEFQLAYIDGPHGFPFPDIEYYYIYPHLDKDALLIIDDIIIPTIYNLYKFINEDDMFEKIDVIGSTAFFRRTGVKTFCPTADGWWLQKYNKKRYPLSSNIVVKMKSYLPEKVKAYLKNKIKK